MFGGAIAGSISTSFGLQGTKGTGAEPSNAAPVRLDEGDLLPINRVPRS